MNATMENARAGVGVAQTGDTTLPRVWVLLGKGTGGNGQMVSLAKELGWPYKTKSLHYNRLNHCPNILLDRTCISLDDKQSDPLTPPWPDVVIAASRRSAPIARWIKQQSGGRTKLVHLLHTQAPLHWFDLIITTPQYGLPELPNVLSITGPLNHVSSEALAAAASHWATKLNSLPRPYTALLVGGNSSTYRFDPKTAARLGKEANAHVRKTKGTLLISTSPRTPAASADALFASLDCSAYCYRWRPHDSGNPYLAYLALADHFIVTGDSASLAIEACQMGKPVALFEWAQRPAIRFFSKWFHHSLQSRSSLAHSGDKPISVCSKSRSLVDGLIYWGFLKPPRDFSSYYQLLQAKGLITKLGEPAVPIPRQPLHDMEQAVSRIRHVMGYE